jgi:hypothetical protein
LVTSVTGYPVASQPRLLVLPPDATTAPDSNFQPNKKAPAHGGGRTALLTEAELANERAVPLDVVLLEIRKKLAPTTDQL